MVVELQENELSSKNLIPPCRTNPNRVRNQRNRFQIIFLEIFILAWIRLLGNMQCECSLANYLSRTCPQKIISSQVPTSAGGIGPKWTRNHIDRHQTIFLAIFLLACVSTRRKLQSSHRECDAKKRSLESNSNMGSCNWTKVNKKTHF